MRKAKHRGWVISSGILGVFLALLFLVMADYSVRLYRDRFGKGGASRADVKIEQSVNGVNTVESVYDMRYSEPDPDVGSLPKPGSRTRVVKKRDDGSTDVDVTYTVDAERRRVTPGQENGPRKQPLLFLGCSYMYGDDLQDEQTLPAAAAKMENQYRVYNYSFHAWGPNNLLRLVRKPGFAEDVPKVAGAKAVYLFIWDHLARIVGSLGIYRLHTDWQSRLPYYYLDAQGDLQTDGMISDRPIRDPLFRVLARSSIFDLFHVDIPRALGREDFELFAAILEDMDRTLKEKLPGIEFTTVIYPGQRGDLLAPFLRERELKFLDYSNVNARQFVSGPLTVSDGFHPSAGLDEFLARRILTDLKIIGPGGR